MENHTTVAASVLGMHDRAAAERTPVPDLTPRAQAVATTKYIDLVQGLGAELGYRTGWRGEAAQRVGISGSLLSQILRGRKVTRGTLEKAVVAMKLPGDYFAAGGVPRTDPPAPRAVGLPVDPLLILEGFRALPHDTRKRLLALMTAIDE